MSNVTELKRDQEMINTLEALLKLAKKGKIQTICGTYKVDNEFDFISEGDANFNIIEQVGAIELFKHELLSD